MEFLDILSQAQGGNALSSIGSQFGLSQAQTSAAMAELAPVIAAGLRRNMAQSPQNVASLLTALQSGNHTRYLDDGDALQFGNVATDGNAILGHIFGSKEVSREVAMRASSSSGIGSSILKKMLPVIASMVIGSLTKKMMGGSAPAPQRRSSGGLGDILGQVFGKGRSSGGGGLGDILGQVFGGGRKRAPQAPSRQSGGLDDLLKDMLGTSETDDQSSWSVDEGAAERTRTTLDDFLGGGTDSGSAADDLLGSVEQHLRRL